MSTKTDFVAFPFSLASPTSFSCRGFFSTTDDSITSLHDSVPSLNTNIYQYYGLGDSNLVPITEEDEKSSFNNNKSDLEEFKRGGVARSTIRNSKKKNFKELKLDMTMCKNNLFL